MKSDNIKVLNHTVKGSKVEMLIFDVGAGKVFKQEYEIEKVE